jgi:hypothetical protein
LQLKFQSLDQINLKNETEPYAELDIQKGKLLIKHLLSIFHDKPDCLNGREQFGDILFNLVVSKAEFNAIENISDFINLVQSAFLKVIDFDNKKNFEIIFLESFEESKTLQVHSKDKCSLDLDNKELLIFMIQTPSTYLADTCDVQTHSMP